MTDIEIQRKYLINPISIVEHTYDDIYGKHVELLIVMKRTYGKLCRIMFRNATGVVADTTIPTNEMYDLTSFVKEFCKILTYQKQYCEQCSQFTYNFITDLAVAVVPNSGSDRYFMYDWVYNPTIAKNELKLREVASGCELPPLKETIIQEADVSNYEQIVKCLEKNGIEIHQHPEVING